MKSNIVLIGCMGAGKTAVGKALAERLHREFIELDSLIKKKTGKSIMEIFQQDDEVTFRELEIEAAREASHKENAVIACGGGIVLNQINIDRLRRNSTIIYLEAAPSVILKRVRKGGEKRPLLEVADPASAIRELLKFRKPLYDRAADIRINTSGSSIESVVNRIIQKLSEHESVNIKK